MAIKQPTRVMLVCEFFSPCFFWAVKKDRPLLVFTLEQQSFDASREFVPGRDCVRRS